MVYASPIDLSSDIIFSDLNTTNKPPVRVFYRDIPLDSIAGPVPYVDLSISYNKTDAGLPLSVTTKATVTGKIIRAPTSGNKNITYASGTGVSVILSGINELKNLFSKNDGQFKLQCGDTDIIKSSGIAKITNFSARPSPDNMVYSADYTVELEFHEVPFSGSAPSDYFLVKDAEDSWSMESLDDYLYMSTSITPSGKTENHNPKLIQPNIPNPSQDLKFVTLPRFKLSRKVSAIGLPYGTGSFNQLGTGQNSAFYNAKGWVENQLAKCFQSPTLSGQPTVSSQAVTNLSNFKNLFLYNHLRSTNFNYFDASYEVNDTWLAMSTGVPYLEDYTIESSTDDKYIKTVRVRGNIEGLAISSINIMKGSGLVPNSGSVLDIRPSMASGEAGNMGITRYDSLDSSLTTKIYNHKYDNAISGWLNDIKPFMYRRACAAINSNDRNQDYIPSTYNVQPPPHNPIYSYERLLNVIPVTNTETHDPRKGSISYTYEYNNRNSLFSGVLSENINLEHTGPVDIFNQAFVLGRRLGPAIQSLGAKTASYKTLTIELSVPVAYDINACFLDSPSCPLYTGGLTFLKMEEVINGLKPFGARTSMFGTIRGDQPGQVYLKGDNITWNPANGSFSRSIQWVYQFCNNNLSRSSLTEM
jgi:hypothetical protein